MSKKLEKRLSWVDEIFRVRGPHQTRFHKLRLDKNERVSDFTKNFFHKTIKKIKHEHLTTYPEVENLYDLLSKKLKVNKNSLILTAGADGAIRSCFDLCVSKGDTVITLSPTFAMIDIYIKFFKAKQIKIKYDHNLRLNYEKLINSINSKISLIVFANPNSPTGTILNHEQVYSILQKAKKNGVTVLIDEAYFGFTSYTALPFIKKFSNLVVARTFSKSFGLAGCRAGYLVSQTSLAKRLFKLKPMYEINSIAVLIATELLKNHSLVKRYLRETRKGKEYLADKLDTLNLKYLESHANFLHINFGKNKKIAERLFKKNNILVKGGPGVTGFENYLRVTLGPKKYMHEVVKVIKKIS